MKKYFVLFITVIALLAFTGGAFASDSSTVSPTTSPVQEPEPGTPNPPQSGDVTPGSGDVTPGSGDVTPGSGDVTPGSGDVTPGSGDVTPGGETSGDIPSGNEDSQTSIEAEPLTIRTSQTITVTTTQTIEITVQKYTDAAYAAVRVVKTVTIEETRQTVVEATNNLRIAATERTTTAMTTVLETARASGGTINTQNFVSELLRTTTDPSDTDTSAQDSSAAIAASLLKGANNTGDTGNIANLISNQRPGESDFDTIMRMVGEVLDNAVRILTSESTANKVKNLAGGGTMSTLTVRQSSMLKSAATTKIVTNEETGETTIVRNEEVMTANDATIMLVQQAAQEASRFADDDMSPEAQDARARQEMLTAQITIATTSSVTTEERGIYMINLPTLKEDTYNKPMQWNTLKEDNRIDTGLRGELPEIVASELNENEDGSAIFLNSIGNVITAVPGKDEWGIPDDNPGGEPQLIIPGYVTVAAYFEPGVVYTPIITVPASSLDIATEETSVSVDITIEETRTVDVPVYHTAAYSTSFDADTLAHFAEQEYNPNIAMFIVSGDRGKVSTSDYVDAIREDRLEVVVQTLPKFSIKGDNANVTADYVIGVSFDIPLENEGYRLVRTDNINDILKFYPYGAEVEGTEGLAAFLDANGEPLSPDEVYAVAAGEAGEETSATTRALRGYAVMRLAKLNDDSPDYTPVFTAQLEEKVTGAIDLSASDSALTLAVGGSKYITIDPGDAVGTVRYDSAITSGDITGLTVAIDSAADPVTVTFSAARAGVYVVRITGIDENDNEDYVDIIVTVIDPTTTPLRIEVDSTLTITLPNTATLRITPRNEIGTVTYGYTVNPPSGLTVAFEGNVATFTPTAANSYNVVITGTDPERPAGNNTATANVAVTVNPASGGIDDPGGNTSGDQSGDIVGTIGSSGGGCSAGFTALALALLGSFIATRKK